VHASLGPWQNQPNEPAAIPSRQLVEIRTPEGEQNPLPTTPQSASVRQLPA
jgi:hypothetical protein